MMRRRIPCRSNIQILPRFLLCPFQTRQGIAQGGINGKRAEQMSEKFATDHDGNDEICLKIDPHISGYLVFL
jgi:hypothetical protein